MGKINVLKEKVIFLDETAGSDFVEISTDYLKENYVKMEMYGKIKGFKPSFFNYIQKTCTKDDYFDWNNGVIFKHIKKLEEYKEKKDENYIKAIITTYANIMSIPCNNSNIQTNILTDFIDYLDTNNYYWILNEKFYNNYFKIGFGNTSIELITLIRKETFRPICYRFIYNPKFDIIPQINTFKKEYTIKQFDYIHYDINKFTYEYYSYQNSCLYDEYTFFPNSNSYGFLINLFYSHNIEAINIYINDFLFKLCDRIDDLSAFSSNYDTSMYSCAAYDYLLEIKKLFLNYEYYSDKLNNIISNYALNKSNDLNQKKKLLLYSLL